MLSRKLHRPDKNVRRMALRYPAYTTPGRSALLIIRQRRFRSDVLLMDQPHSL